MSGQHSLRGYIIQSIIAILDSVSDQTWVSVTVEPNNESEKVDIKWMYSDESKKVAQIKSSINIFKYSQAKKWCDELESGVTDAEKYELILVGHPDEKLSRTFQVGKVSIAPFKSLNIEALIDEASTKIDKFYESHNKPKINATVRELLVKILIQEMNFNAIAGVDILRTDFEMNLLNWLSAFERQVAINPWTIFAPFTSELKRPIEKRIVDKILNLVGWNNFNEDELVQIFNEHLGKENSYSLSFRGEFESPLMDNTHDFLMINTHYDVSYSNIEKNIVQSQLETLSIFEKEYKSKNKIPVKPNETTLLFGIIFLLSSDNDDLHKDYIRVVRDYFKREYLKDDVQYFVVDNARATFLISSIISAKNYRSELPIKFLYPITDLNSSPSKIGKRGLQLPPQYINSSIIPIVKESYDKISILLYCADNYSADALKKLIWLIIRLTGGYGNEYIIYFADFEEEYSNEVKEVIRSFNDIDLNSKLKVQKFIRVESEAISDLQTNQIVLQDQKFNETNLSDKDNSKILNKAFIEILPYGDILKPFLKTDAITANDLKIFLSKKGVFEKNADKKRLITTITTLLFSPRELEDFKEMIDIKEKPTKSSQEIYKLKSNITIEEVIQSLAPVNINDLTRNTETKLLGNPVFQKNPENPKEYILEIKTEKMDPTNYLSVNTLYGKVSISCKIDSGNLFVNSIKTITTDDKIIAARILITNKECLVQKEIIENDSIEVLFSRFSCNKDRVNFLLSFSNILSSSLFNEAEIRSIKFKYDKNEKIPETLMDKTEHDIVTYLNGRDLAGLIEISKEELKRILLLDEIVITYKFHWQNVKYGLYTVKYNFSNSLYNKKGVEGTFRSETNLIMTSDVKNLSNIEKLKRDLANEIENVKLSKLREFNII